MTTKERLDARYQKALANLDKAMFKVRVASGALNMAQRRYNSAVQAQSEADTLLFVADQKRQAYARKVLKG